MTKSESCWERCSRQPDLHPAKAGAECVSDAAHHVTRSSCYFAVDVESNRRSHISIMSRTGRNRVSQGHGVSEHALGDSWAKPGAGDEVHVARTRHRCRDRRSPIGGVRCASWLDVHRVSARRVARRGCVRWRLAKYSGCASGQAPGGVANCTVQAPRSDIADCETDSARRRESPDRWTLGTFPLFPDTTHGRFVMLQPCTFKLVKLVATIKAAFIATVIVSCSNAYDAASPTTLPSATTAAHLTTSTATPPVVGVTSTTSTSMAPTTTVDVVDVLIADIEADLNEANEALDAVGADPASPTVRALLNDYFTDDALARYNQYFDELVRDGLTTRASAEVASFIEVLELIDVDDDRVTVVTCQIDSAVVVQLQPDGSEVILDDAVLRYDTKVELVFDGERWKSRGGGEQLRELAEVTTCD
jgi:hypothetical protein